MYNPSMVVYGVTRSVLLTLYKIFFNFKACHAERVEHLDVSRGIILAPNHASFLDPPVLGISLKRHVTYLAKDYLFKKFFLGWHLKKIGAFPIKSESDDFRTIRELVRLLKAGRCLVVFPEGTRSHTGDFKQPEGGVGFLAMKGKAVVVPVYIQGTFEALPRNAKFFKCSPVRAYFGEPFVPSEEPEFEGMKEPYLAISQKIMTKIAQIKFEVEKGLMSSTNS